MKKMLTIGLALALLGLLSASAMAANNAADLVTITVNSVSNLQVPATTALTLDQLAASAEVYTNNYTQAEEVDTNGFKLSHNDIANQVVTATASGVTAGSDIALTVELEGGDGPKAVVTAGAAATAQVLKVAGLAAGAHELDLTWTANATLSGTPPAAYDATVTFTLTDFSE